MSGAHDRPEPSGDAAPPGVVEIAVLVLAVLGGLALRVWAPSPLWLDEALSVHIAELPLGDIAEALRHDGHPPLYYWLLHATTAVLGDGDGAVRALSALSSVLLLPLMWLLGRDVAGPRAGRLALALAASSPFVVRYGTETRMYALVMVLTAAGALLVRRGLRAPTRATTVGLALVTAALVLTHYWALWLGAATVVALVLLVWREPTRRAAATRLIGSLAVGGLALVPWLPSMLEQVAHTGTPWAPPTRPSVVGAVTIADLGGGFVRDAELLGTMLVVLVLIGLLARPLDGARLELDLRTVPGVRGEVGVAVGTLAIGAVAGIVGSAAFAGRYAAAIAPMLLLAAAVGLARLPLRVVRDAATAVVVVGGLAIGAVNAADDRTQAGAHASAIAEVAVPGDLVVTCPDQLGPSLRRLLDDDVALLTYPDLGDGRLVDWRDYAERNDAADPGQVGAEIVERLDPTAAVFITWGGDYRTLEGDCEALVSALQAQLPRRVDLVAADGAIFEHATLTWLRPAAP